MKKFKTKLLGPRLVLRITKPTLKMAKTMFAAIDSNREHLRPWFPWEKKTEKMEDSMAYLVDKEKQLQAMSKVEYGIYIDGQYAGNIGLFDINFDKGSAQIGYWLSVDFLKRGYMSEAVRVLEENAFNHLGLHRLEISCDEDNLPSAGVIKRCSYFFEGLKRENYYNEHFGAYRSTLVFSKLSKEFNVVSH